MTTATTRHSDRRISPVFVGILAVTAVTGWATWTGFAAQPGVAVFLFVTSAWIVSLCLHEYAHARTALHSGDISIGAKGYLTLNPLKYTHVALSIVLPLIFVIMGGIGLPGGAVFIERHRIQGRWRHSLISAAGPLTNVLFAAALTAPFWLGVEIGWIAGLEHQVDVEAIPIRAALQRVLEERPEVRVTSFGLGLGLPRDRYRHVNVVNLMELTRTAGTFDIGIAPLSDIAMNRARSNVKLKEYSAAGACWLASPIGPYAGMGEKQGGRLVADDRWHEELVRLLDKPRDRAKLAKRAGKWVVGETLSKQMRTWESRLQAAVARARTATAVA
jgi:hypothetical protein